MSLDLWMGTHHDAFKKKFEGPHSLMYISSKVHFSDLVICRYRWNLMKCNLMWSECMKTTTYLKGEDLVSRAPTNSSELPSSSSAVERFSMLRLPHLRGVALMDLTNLFELSSRDCSSFSQEISAIAKIRIENTIV